MSDERPNISKAILSPLNHAIAAGEREALKVGVPTHEVLEMLLNHLASVVSLIEPPGAREAALKDVVGSFATLVKQHVDRRMTSPAGLHLPRPREAFGLSEEPTL